MYGITLNSYKCITNPTKGTPHKSKHQTLKHQMKDTPHMHTLHTHTRTKLTTHQRS